MKKYIVNIVIPVLALCGFFACSDWTEPESIYPNLPNGKSPEYYANLRDWKLNTKHPRTFGWYGNWSGKGASGKNRLMGLPDSVDFVSMWGNWHSLSPEQMADKKAAYDIKGLRVKICFIIGHIGDQVTPKAVRDNWQANGFANEQDAVYDFWGWEESNKNTWDPAIRKYADAIADTIVKYDFKGFDFDLERDFGAAGSLVGGYNYKEDKDYGNRISNITTFLDQMSKTCGPLSGTDRLLCVDGQPNIIETKCAKMLDFFIMQAYYARNISDLDGGGYTPRVVPVVNHFKEYFKTEMGYGTDEAATKEIMSRIILCEDFEQEPGKGGNGNGSTGPGPGIFTTRDGRKLPPVWGMADYYSKEGYQVGGAGIFHMEADFDNTYSTISEIHKDNNMKLDPAKTNGGQCYGYLNGIIQLLHSPVNPAATPTVE